MTFHWIIFILIFQLEFFVNICKLSVYIVECWSFREICCLVPIVFCMFSCHITWTDSWMDGLVYFNGRVIRR